MTTLWEAATTLTGGSTPTATTTTLTVYPVALPFQNPGGPVQPGAPVTGTAILPTQQVLILGQRSYDQLRQYDYLKSLFDAVPKIKDVSTIEQRIAALIQTTPTFSSSDFRLNAINNVDNALFMFDPKKSFSDFSLDDRKRMHALLSLRQQLFAGLDSTTREIYLAQQRMKPVAQWPLNTILFSIARNPTPNNLNYARRIVDWQYIDPTALQTFITLLQTIGATQSDAGRAASAILPLLQMRAQQLALKVSEDGKCGPENRNTRCPRNQCCMNSGECGRCDGGSGGIGMMRPDFVYNGEGVLPAFPATFFGGANI